MYNYQTIKPVLFTDDGQRLLFKVRDKALDRIKASGTVRVNEVILAIYGDDWAKLACFDRLVELGEIAEVTRPGVAGQHRVFVSCRS